MKKLRGEHKQDALHDGGRRYCAVAAAIVGSVASAGIGAAASNSAAKKGAAAMDRATEANAYQGEIAKDQWNSYKTMYQPMEQKMIGAARDYDTPEARNAAAAEAQANVSSEIGKAQQRLSRTVGFDPSSAAAQAAQTNLALSGAAMGATAQNTARQKVKDTAYARQLDMLGMGKGLVANASTGMANAASTASNIAASQGRLAGDQAAAAGQMVGGITAGLSKMDWSKFTSSPGNGMTNANMFTGGNDGWSMPGGESMGT